MIDVLRRNFYIQAKIASRSCTDLLNKYPAFFEKGRGAGEGKNFFLVKKIFPLLRFPSAYQKQRVFI